MNQTHIHHQRGETHSGTSLGTFPVFCALVNISGISVSMWRMSITRSILWAVGSPREAFTLTPANHRLQHPTIHSFGRPAKAFPAIFVASL
uniref:Uncharacterized protein n=1 Tax=Parascaris univalens TaxID=6257 RepID=A0A915C210_PARUN